MRIGVGCYGNNGHQIHHHLAEHPLARLVAISHISPDELPEPLRVPGAVRYVETLDDVLADPQVELVSLCSARRATQADDAIRCLEAGKHVYAEKPCALSEADLDRILHAAAKHGCVFREMCETAYDEPYRTMGALVCGGEIGEVVQVFVQKSYPYMDTRPQDDDTDGGLLSWVGVHALRYVEHITGVQISQIQATETRHGNPEEGGLCMACSMQMELANGALATAICNYLNPPGFGRWGNEHVRIFGKRGMVEAVDGGVRTRLVIDGDDRGALAVEPASFPYHDLVFFAIRGDERFDRSLEEELHPTRMVLRAKEKVTTVS